MLDMNKQIVEEMEGTRMELLTETDSKDKIGNVKKIFIVIWKRT